MCGSSHTENSRTQYFGVLGKGYEMYTLFKTAYNFARKDDNLVCKKTIFSYSTLTVLLIVCLISRSIFS